MDILNEGDTIKSIESCEQRKYIIGGHILLNLKA